MEPEPPRQASQLFVVVAAIDLFKIQKPLGLRLAKHLDRCVQADQQHVIPGDSRHRVRRLKQPAVVPPSTVVQTVVAEKGHLKAPLGRGSDLPCALLPGGGGGGGIKLSVHRVRRAIRQETVVQKLVPLVVALAGDRLKCRARNLVWVRHLGTGDAGQHFQLGHPAKQRRDQRLHRHQRTVARPGVAP